MCSDEKCFQGNKAEIGIGNAEGEATASATAGVAFSPYPKQREGDLPKAEIVTCHFLLNLQSQWKLLCTECPRLITSISGHPLWQLMLWWHHLSCWQCTLLWPPIQKPVTPLGVPPLLCPFTAPPSGLSFGAENWREGRNLVHQLYHSNTNEDRILNYLKIKTATIYNDLFYT